MHRSKSDIRTSGQRGRFRQALQFLRGWLVVAGLFAILPLAACQNGNILDRWVGGAAPRPNDPAELVTQRSSESDAALWLGRRAIPLAAPAAAPEIKGVAGADAPSRTWQVRAGESVASTVRRWADMAGYTPMPTFTTTESWNFIVNQEFSGSFEEALIWLSNGFSRQSLKPVAILFANRILDLVDQPTAGVLAAPAQSDHLAQRAAEE